MKTEYEIVHDEAREQSSRGRKVWTINVNGQPTMFWAPTEAAAQRVVDRLKAGRSGEAFGGAGMALLDGKKAEVEAQLVVATSHGHLHPHFHEGDKKSARGKVVQAGEVVIETVTTKSGREKPREKWPGFAFELDGKLKEGVVVTSEAEAKRLCAAEAFVTRGKLGRFEEAERTFRDQFGKDCKVHVLDLPGTALHRKVVIKDADGGLWEVGFKKVGVKFTSVVPAPPKE